MLPTRDQLRLINLLQDALELADHLGMTIVGCQIDHALATVEARCGLERAGTADSAQSRT